MDDDIAGNCDASSANNGEESELQFRELGRKLCEEIEGKFFSDCLGIVGFRLNL